MKSTASLLLVIAAIGTPSAIHRPQFDPMHAAHLRVALNDQAKDVPAKVAPDASLYQLDSAWNTDDERSIELKALRGRCQLLALMFTRCTGICPLTVAALRTFYRQLPKHADDRIHVALVTIDPSDTSELLRAYRGKMQLDKDWLLLRGSPDSIRELSAALGFSYEAQGDQFAHTNQVTVLDRDGVVAHQQAGIGGSIQELQGALTRVCLR